MSAIKVGSKPIRRIFAVSDLHVDLKQNRTWFEALSLFDYQDAALILAGDLSDNLDRLQTTLAWACQKFAQVFFVPGNHELWVRSSECPDSIAKFWQVMQLCDALGVQTRPAQVGVSEATDGVWIVPLFSWYVQPEEGHDSLFVPKPGEDPTLQMWSDKYFTRWPSDGVRVADYFLQLNQAHLTHPYDAPIITFSHFLPRRDLIFSTPEERQAMGVSPHDPHPRFNFSRVAGCTGIEAQLRRIGSVIHVYGHQHRNRHRLINGVRYISHCLGYPRERQPGRQPEALEGPRLIWPM